MKQKEEKADSEAQVTGDTMSEKINNKTTVSYKTMISNKTLDVFDEDS